MENTYERMNRKHLSDEQIVRGDLKLEEMIRDYHDDPMRGHL